MVSELSTLIFRVRVFMVCGRALYKTFLGDFLIMCNIANFLLTYIWLIFTYFIDFFTFTVCQFGCLSTVLYCLLLYCYLNFPKEMNKVSTNVLAWLWLSVIRFKVWQGNGSYGLLMVASKDVPLHRVFVWVCCCYHKINMYKTTTEV